MKVEDNPFEDAPLFESEPTQQFRIVDKNISVDDTTDFYTSENDYEDESEFSFSRPEATHFTIIDGTAEHMGLLNYQSENDYDGIQFISDNKKYGADNDGSILSIKRVRILSLTASFLIGIFLVGYAITISNNKKESEPETLQANSGVDLDQPINQLNIPDDEVVTTNTTIIDNVEDNKNTTVSSFVQKIKDTSVKTSKVTQTTKKPTTETTKKPTTETTKKPTTETTKKPTTETTPGTTGATITSPTFVEK